MHKLTMLSVAVATTFALAAGTASADSFCVSDAACVAGGGKDEAANLQTALNDAAAHPGPDRVRVGAGTFASGPYQYLDPNPANPVMLDGAGRGTTKISMPTIDNVTVLAVRSTSTVSDLGVDLPSGTQGTTALNLSDPGSTATGIAVGGSGSGTGVGLNGGTLEHSSVSFGLQSVDRSVVANNAGGTIADDVLTGGSVDLKAPTGTVTIRRTRIATASNAIQQECGRVDVDDSLIDVRTANNYAAFYAVSSSCANGVDNTARLRHVTALGGVTPGFGVLVNGADPAAKRTIAVTDSVLAGFPAAVDRESFGSALNVTLDHSAYDAATIVTKNANGGTGGVAETAPLGVGTGFVDPGNGDYHLLASSPLVDAGNPAGLGAGESATDLDGADRVVDGNGDGTAIGDVGAFEYQPPAAPQPPAPPAPPPAPASGDGGAPSGSSGSAGDPAGSGASSDTTASGTPAGTSGAPHAPKLTLAGRKRQHLGRRGRLVLIASADEPVTLTAGVAAGKPVGVAGAATSTRLVIALPKTTVRKARAKLARHKRVAVTVSVSARDSAGQTATATRRIALAR
jgi:hypothetical protein